MKKILLSIIMIVVLMGGKSPVAAQETDTASAGYAIGMTYNIFLFQTEIDRDEQADYRKFFGFNYGFEFPLVKRGRYQLLSRFYPMDFRWIKVEQDEDKTMPDTVLHENEGYFTGLLTLDVTNRFTFTDYFQIDLGLAYSLAHTYRRFYVEEFNGEDVRTSHTVKKNFHQLTAFMNLGFGVDTKFTLEARYRLTDIVDDPGYPKLPRFEAGLGFRI